ncbi:hypothetical protein HDU99_009040, partial [Rhizoclosmatium hyalinum]
ILLPSLVLQCANHFATAVLKPQNSLAFYEICHRIDLTELKERALLCALEDLEIAIEGGRNVLSGMSDDSVESLLLYEPMTFEERQLLYCCWVNSREHHVVDTDNGNCHTFEDLISDESEPIWISDLISTPESDELSLMDRIFPSSVVWGHRTLRPKDSKLFDSAAVFNSFWDSIKQATLSARSSNFSIKPQLLFRASEHDFSNAAFHKYCDYEPNTLVILKTVDGNLVGGFTDAPWSSSHTGWVPVRSAFLFTFLMKSPGKWMLDVMPCVDLAKGIYCKPEFGPIFGSGHDLKVCGRECSVAFESGSYKTGGVGAASTFLGVGRLVSRNKAQESCKLEEYE